MTEQGVPDEEIKTGRRIAISPITNNTYVVTKWREHSDGKIVALQKEAIEDRLFIPLKTEHYRSFERGSKDIELRGVNEKFNLDTVRQGRWTELRRGYATDDSLWGEIGSVWLFDSISEITDEIDHSRILPQADRGGFEDSARDLLGGYDQFIAFEVEVIGSAEP